MIVITDPVSTGPTLSAALQDRGEQPLHLYQRSFQQAFDADPHPHKCIVTDWRAGLKHLANENVTAVIAGSEMGVTIANQLSHALGLPHHDNRTANARRDKAAMNSTIRAAGIPTAWTVEVHDLASARAAVADITHFPVIVKPPDSAGGDGCVVARSANQVLEAVEDTLGRVNLTGSRNAKMVIQEYLSGPQYIVNTVSMAGHHLVSDVHSVLIDQIGDRSVMRHSLLLSVLDVAESQMVDYVLQCLDAVGVREGAAHTEVRITPDGPRLIEVNARIMGASLEPELYRPALGGSSQADLVAERFTDPESFALRFDRPYAPTSTLAMVFLTVAEQGTVKGYPGLAEVRRLPGFHSLEKVPGVNARITEPWMCTGQAGMAYFLHDDATLITDSIARLHELENRGKLYQMWPISSTDRVA